MTAFAYYRLPYLHHANFVAQHLGEPEVLSSVAELNGKEGFVIAPFSPSSDCPVLLIHPDESRLLAISDERAVSSSESELEESIPARDIYAEDFECFHRELEKGTFRKIVLARKATLRTADKDFEKLFMKACRMYISYACDEGLKGTLPKKSSAYINILVIFAIFSALIYFTILFHHQLGIDAILQSL